MSEAKINTLIGTYKELMLSELKAIKHKSIELQRIRQEAADTGILNKSGHALVAAQLSVNTAKYDAYIKIVEDLIDLKTPLKLGIVV